MMKKMTIGVDISKANLDVHRLPDGAARQFSNNPSGFKKLIRWLAKAPSHNLVEQIIFEATGVYHRAFERAMSSAGFVLCKVNPRQARHFAKATGKLAKTDKVDAMMLARMGVALEPEPTVPVSQLIDSMRQLRLARLALMKDKTAALNRQSQYSLPLLQHQNKLRLQQINKEIKAIDVELQKLCSSDTELRCRLDIVKSIPSIGDVSAMALIAEMPELGSMDKRQAASLAGLAPVTRQSGKWEGKSFIQGGRRHLRTALYMPALVASRRNPDLKKVYDALIAAGKPAKLALVVIMRKLVVIANSLIRDQRKWTDNSA